MLSNSHDAMFLPMEQCLVHKLLPEEFLVLWDLGHGRGAFLRASADYPGATKVSPDHGNSRNM